MNLYIVRHGNPNYGLDSLTELGHKQAASCAKEMSNWKIDEIYASNMGRAKETAQYLADLINKPVNIEPWAHEIESWSDDGHGNKCYTVSVDPTILRSPEMEALGDDWLSHPVFEGSNAQAMIDEIENGAADFLRRQGYVLEGNRFRILDPEHPNEKNVALFCHAGMFLVLTSYLLRIPQVAAWNSLFMYQTGICWCNLNNFSTGYTVPRYYFVNNTNHLVKDGIQIS